MVIFTDLKRTWSYIYQCILPVPCKFKFLKQVVYQAVFGNLSVFFWSTKAPVQVSVKKKNLLFNKVHLETKEKVPKAKGKTHVIVHFVTRADKRHQKKLHLWLHFLSLQLGKNLKNMTCTFNKVKYNWTEWANEE